MKYLLFVVLFVTVLLLSCTKNDNPPQTEDPPPTGDTIPRQSNDPTIMALEAHVWVFDSIETMHNGMVVDSVIEPDSPKIEMWYTDDKLYFNFPGGPQNDAFNYEVKDGNKLYRWRPGNLENEYFIIQQLTDRLFVLSTHDEDYLEYDYYSAKE